MDNIDLKDLVQKTKKLRILYVEDNEETRLQAIKILNNFFTNITVAVNGADGLNQYKDNPSNYYDLIITDINMPIMNGIDMAKAILKINRHQIILFLTAYNNPEYLEKIINMGVKNYIHKPVKIDNLIESLSKVIEDIEEYNLQIEEFKKIEKLNRELDSLVDTFDTYVIASRTDLKGDITYASKAYTKISGYKKEELLRNNHNLIRHPDMPPEVFKELWDTIKAHRLWEGEIKNLRKDGTYYWVKASIAPHFDLDGKHIGYSAIRIDITDKKEVEKLNEDIRALLDNTEQGFLSFDKDMKICKSYSKECLNIFEKEDIANNNICDLLFRDNVDKKEFFYDAAIKVLDNDDCSSNDQVKDMYLSLLPKELKLKGKDITIEYKLISHKIMLIITDITKRKKLELKIKKQNQIQKMIVAVVTNKNDFLELKFEFESLLLSPPKDLNILLRRLHTFKGVFAQKEMLNIVDGIHDLESKLCNIKNDISNKEALDIFNSHNLQDIFNLDLEILIQNLGEKFFQDSFDSNVDLNLVNSLEKEIKKLYKKETCRSFEDILYYLEKLRYITLYSMLSIYPLAVNKMVKNLKKEVYPLKIEGDRLLSVSDKFKPFIKSLIHIFNNCVDHGIEPIDLRIKNNKDEIGTIKCRFEQKKDTLEISISDDGLGLDIKKLSQAAIDKGIKTKKQLANLDDNDKLFLIFLDRLSTKEDVSKISGRGVGLSSIKNEVEKLNGSIKIINNVGYGVEFIFTFPLDT